MNRITFKPVQIKIIDKDHNLFLEIRREAYKNGQIVDAEQQVVAGQPTGTYFFGNCVAYEGLTAELITK